MKKSLLNHLWKVLLFCAFVSINIESQAQQDPEYTMYMFNGLALNPAYAGTREAMSFTALGRYQWVNIEGAPKTVALSLHSPVKDRVGLGIMSVYDQIGPHDKIDVFASYAYRFPVGERATLSAGLQGGIQYYNSRYSQVQTNVGGDPNFQDDLTRMFPNFGAGLYLYAERFYIGASVPHLINNRLKPDNTGGDVDISLVAHQYRHYFLTGGIVVPMGNNFDLKPSFLLKSVPGVSPLQADLNLSLLIKKALWIGASYRSFDSIDFIVEFQFNPNLRAGYAYDFTITELSNYTTGSHEVMIGYDWGFQKEKIITPRYF